MNMYMIILFIRSLWENLKRNIWVAEVAFWVWMLLEIGDFHDKHLVIKICSYWFIFHIQLNGVLLGLHVAWGTYKKYIKEKHTIFSFLMCLMLTPVFINRVLWNGLLGNNILLGGYLGFFWWFIFFYMVDKYLISKAT